MTTDTAPDPTADGSVDPDNLGLEPAPAVETDKERRARRARNSRKLKKAAKAAQAEATPKGPGRPTNATKREKAVLGVITGIGIGVALVDETDAKIIMDGAPNLAASLARLADTNPRIAKALDALTETSAWGEVVLAAGAIVLPIISHHRQVAAIARAEAEAAYATEAVYAEGDGPGFTVPVG